MVSASVTCAAGPPHAIVATSRTSQTERKAIREDRRKTSFPDPALRLRKLIRRTMEGHRARRKVQHRVCGTRISIAGLAHAAGIHKRAGGERVGSLVLHSAGLSFRIGPKQRGDMRVAGAAVRRLRERERSGRAPRISDVLPEGIAQAPMTKSDAACLEGPGESGEHVALRGREPPLMYLRRDRGGRIEEVEIFARRDGAVMVGRDDGGLPLNEEREHV